MMNNERPQDREDSSDLQAIYIFMSIAIVGISVPILMKGSTGAILMGTFLNMIPAVILTRAAFSKVTKTVAKIKAQKKNKARASFIEIGYDNHLSQEMANFGLTKAHIESSGYSETTRYLMNTLMNAGISKNGPKIYKLVIDMPEYQVRGLRNGFTLEQMGIQKNWWGGIAKPSNNAFAGFTIDALEYFNDRNNRNQFNIPMDDRVEIALSLNSRQVLGMIEFGLTLEQINSPFFLTNPNILGELAFTLRESSNIENYELYLPLPASEKARSSAIFDRISINAEDQVSLEDLNSPLSRNISFDTADIETGKLDKNLDYDVPATLHELTLPQDSEDNIKIDNLKKIKSLEERISNLPKTIERLNSSERETENSTKKKARKKAPPL
ncbi:hypothetical protein [Ascidiimonas sp. W6]|uniref:hypothetical protein n=1 Tax=Ascidiimonas meishanensis TaxID=3128903 RepID=UPI0030EF48B9